MQEITNKLDEARIISQSQLERFKSLAERAEKMYKEKAQEEEDLELDDAPEEYKG